MTVFRDYVAGVSQPSLTGNQAPTFDELIAPDGSLRPGWATLAEAAVQITEDDLRRVGADIQRMLADDGVTYLPPSAEGDAEPEPWRLDPMPLVMTAEEWAPLEIGLAQRSELLNAILVDLYGPQRLLSEQVLPPAAVFGHAGFLRVVARASASDERPLLFAATDLGRNEAGEWVATADRTQAPSGVGYAMENRRVLSRVIPDLYSRAGLHRMAPFFQALRSALIEAAPDDRPNPRVAVLSPGAGSETAYDQAFVASSLGFPLVEGSDLTMRDGAVWMRVFGRLERVDVILRRVDASWSDALELRKGSQLGVSGLNEAIRRGTVKVVNGLGAGVVENPALMPYLPQISELLLNEPLRLPSVPTWWCGEAAGREAVLDQLDDLVIRAIDDPSEVLSLAGESTLAGESKLGLRERILAAPHRFVGQQPLALSQAPTFGPQGVMARPVTVRAFTMRHGSGFRPLLGGLASVYDKGQPIASKDVWVLKENSEDADQGVAELLPMTHTRAPDALVPRMLDDLFWFGRYSERAEDMLRLVLTAHATAQDYANRPHSSGAEALAVLTGAIARLVGPQPESSLDQQFRAVLLESRRKGTVAQAFYGLRQSAQSVRDQLSEDIWHALGDIERASVLLRTHANSHQINESGGRMLTGVLALQGVTANMMRDPGWRMIETGRFIERSLQLALLLRATCVTRRGIDVDRDVHTAVLTAAESVVTHRRRYRGYVRVRGVLELLLHDETNPRSLAFAIERIREHLAAMPESTGATRPERLLDDLGDLVAAADISALALAEGERRVHLDGFLAEYLDSMSRLAEAVGEIHFAPPPTPRIFGFATVEEGAV